MRQLIMWLVIEKSDQKKKKERKNIQHSVLYLIPCRDS